MLTKARVRDWLQQRFSLRLHMTLILGGTFFAGLLATRLQMSAGVDRLAVRYVVAVCVAYIAFLILIRLWLAYVNSGADGADIASDALEAVDLFDPVLPAPRFQGSGSSGSWGDVSLDGGDLGEVVVIILFALFVVLLCGFAIYFIYTAPALLSEAAFEAILAAALVRRARKATGPGWIGPVWRATVWPFVVVLLLAGTLGWAAQRWCPGARRLSEALSCAPFVAQPPGVAGHAR
jgi:hypothetical protein